MKNFAMVREAVRLFDQGCDSGVVLVALGGRPSIERIGKSEIHSRPFESDTEVVARYFQAADVYAHAARADTFPTTILEALACGIPVVATALCGIPEQVRPLALDYGRPDVDSRSYGEHQATGILVGPGDALAMARSFELLLGNRRLREEIGANAKCDAAERFDLEAQADSYLNWYRELAARGIERGRRAKSPAMVQSRAGLFARDGALSERPERAPARSPG
jgi:glycosyltransferase involved in cell wall biosynthesis